jgi:hypothetical protein
MSISDVPQKSDLPGSLRRLSDLSRTTKEGAVPVQHLLAATATVSLRVAPIVAEDVIGNTTVAITLNRQQTSRDHDVDIAVH